MLVCKTKPLNSVSSLAIRASRQCFVELSPTAGRPANLKEETAISKDARLSVRHRRKRDFTMGADGLANVSTLYFRDGPSTGDHLLARV